MKEGGGDNSCLSGDCGAPPVFFFSLFLSDMSCHFSARFNTVVISVPRHETRICRLSQATSWWHGKGINCGDMFINIEKVQVTPCWKRIMAPN